MICLDMPELPSPPEINIFSLGVSTLITVLKNYFCFSDVSIIVVIRCITFRHAYTGSSGFWKVKVSAANFCKMFLQKIRIGNTAFESVI